MIVGGYSLDLYCKYSSLSDGTNAGKRHTAYGDKGFNQFHGDSFSECKKIAKRYGWKWVNKDVICIKCQREGLK